MELLTVKHFYIISSYSNFYFVMLDGWMDGLMDRWIMDYGRWMCRYDGYWIEDKE